MGAGIFGRDAEFRAIEVFLDGLPRAAAALVLDGEPGAGKTTLLRAAAARAGERGLVVLMATPSHGDLQLAFAGLSDLLESRLDDILGDLPSPQRRALAVALLRDEPQQRPPEPRVIAAAFRSALLALSRSAPLLVVIDDVQWLDRPSETAVGFTFRRIEHEPVGLLCAQRAETPGAELPLDLAHARLRAEALTLGGLSLGALHHMLTVRLGTSFSRTTLLRIEAESGGNPFIALEIGRALARRGITRVGSAVLPVPDTLSGLVDERLRELPSGAAAALQAVAVMPDALPRSYLAAGADAACLDAAVLAGVLDAGAGRLRFSHPLLASAVTASIPPARLRELHATAARLTRIPEERAWHRALAVAGRSAAVAAELDEAGRGAAARGAPAAAAELFELAASVTPVQDPAAGSRRLLDAARQLAISGETRAARESLQQLVASMPKGRERARALSLLGWLSVSDFAVAAPLLDQALAEAADDAALGADIHFCLSDAWSNRGDQARALTEARLALSDAECAEDPALIASSLALVFDSEWMAGAEPDEGLLSRALDLERSVGGSLPRFSPSRSAGIYHYLRGSLEEAEAELQRVLARAEADGIEDWRADMLLRLSQVARRRGETGKAARLAAAALESAEQLDLPRPTSSALYSAAAAALQAGQAETVRELARRGMELARRSGDRPLLVCHQALLGSLDLALGDYPAAAARLVPLAAPVLEIGWQPSTQSMAPDVAEALLVVGKLDEAGAFLSELERGMPDPVTAALVARCRGALAAARGEPETAVALLIAALRLHDTVSPQPVERGRTLLVLGGVQRRLKQRRAARQTLGEAISAFQAAGAALWIERGRAELARVSGRAPGSGELTTSELRVAELIASGLTNREAAAELFITVRAVESTLTKIYAKLGVRSRTQLARQLHDPG